MSPFLIQQNFSVKIKLQNSTVVMGCFNLATINMSNRHYLKSGCKTHSTGSDTWVQYHVSRLLHSVPVKLRGRACHFVRSRILSFWHLPIHPTQQKPGKKCRCEDPMPFLNRFHQLCQTSRHQNCSSIQNLSTPSFQLRTQQKKGRLSGTLKWPNPKLRLVEQGQQH